MNRSLLLVTVAAAAALILSPAQAQTAQESAEEPRVLQEVLVTVERREQNLQDVAALAQAFDADDLALAGVGSELRNLPFLVPGLNVANQEGNVEIFIRGVGSTNNTELGDPAAAPHLNGVYIPRPRGLGAMFFDLDRVEINKGPQGTLRGRNAVAGTMNIITRRPQLGEFDGYVQAGLGNHDSRELEGAVNLPLGEQFAVRVAGFSEYHDSYFDNAGLSNNLTPAGVEDEQAGRLSALWQPNEALSVLLVGDYVREGGTGYPGANMFGTFAQVRTGGAITFPGFDFDDVDPRQVVNRGWQGDLDSKHWGASATVTYDFGPFALEYLGSYRDLDFSQINAESDGIAFPGRDLTAINYDNWSNQFWLTRSKSNVHELRLFSPDDARARWTAGIFHFDEAQEVGFFSTNDNAGDPGACCFSGVEFTMPDVDGESLAGFADVTFDVTDALRVKAGLRHTEEEKSRFGVGGNWQIIALGGENFDCCFGTRFSTPGFVPLFVDRPSFDVSDRSREALAQFLLEGARFGLRDTFQTQITGVVDGSVPNGTCVDRSDIDNGRLNCVSGPGGTPTHTFIADIIAPQQQFGEYEDDFLDWRGGVELDLSDDNLLYASVTTGHKSGGFNDTVQNADFDPGQPEGPTNPRLLQPVVFSPEKVTAWEIGSKNVLDWNGRALVLNAAAFYYDYQDQVFTVLRAIADPAPGNPVPPSVQESVNIAESSVRGVELESVLELTRGFAVATNLLWLDTEIQEGVVSDTRATNFGSLGATPNADLEGNELPLAPEFTAVVKLQQVIDLGSGAKVDWQILANYKADYFLTIFNEQGVVEPTTPPTDLDGDGTVGIADASVLGFADRQESFVTLNAGLAFTSADGALRVEGFIANILDEDASTKALFAPGLNLRFLNDPRTYGVRLGYRF